MCCARWGCVSSPCICEWDPPLKSQNDQLSFIFRSQNAATTVAGYSLLRVNASFLLFLLFLLFLPFLPLMTDCHWRKPVAAACHCIGGRLFTLCCLSNSGLQHQLPTFRFSLRVESGQPVRKTHWRLCVTFVRPALYSQWSAGSGVPGQDARGCEIDVNN